MATFLMPTPRARSFTDAGVPAASYLLYTYAAGTTTPKAAFTDSAGLVPHPNPIVLDAKGEVLAYFDGNYKLELKTPLGVTVTGYPVDNFETPLMASSLTASAGGGMVGFLYAAVYGAGTIGKWLQDLATSGGSTFIGFIHAGIGSVIRTAQDKLRDKVHVKDWGIVGDGSDETTKLQACYTANPGKVIDHGDTLTIGISATVNLASNTVYRGRSKIKAINAANITGAMLLGTAKTGVRVEGLEIDANKANTGARYGLWFIGGSRNIVRDIYNHDTIQAGAILEGESDSWIEGGYFLNNGENTGTDNHGIMIVSTSTSNLASGARGVRVVNSYRKGITAYAGVGGSVKYIAITGCTVSGCGLGGVYLGNAPGAADQENAVLDGNICFSNYVNFEIANVKRVTGSGNISLSSTAQGVVLNGVTDGVMPGFMISDSGTDGMNLTNCVNVAMGVINIRRSNRATAGFGPGLQLVASTYCTFSSGSIIYDETPLTTHGIIEQGACDYNDFTDITVVGATAALYTIVGANTRMRTRSGRFTGLGAITPLNTLDIAGGLTIRSQGLTLVAGANQDVALPANAGFLTIEGPAGAYSIGGIAGGHAGRRLTLFNYTSQALTLNHGDAGSSSGNRFVLPGSVSKAVASFGCVEVVYNSSASGWVVVG